MNKPGKITFRDPKTGVEQTYVAVVLKERIKHEDGTPRLMERIRPQDTTYIDGGEQFYIAFMLQNCVTPEG